MKPPKLLHPIALRFLLIIATLCLGATHVQAQSGPELGASVGLLRPSITPYSAVLHPEVVASVPIGHLGAARNASLAFAMGFWAGGPSSEQCLHCSSYDYRAWTIGAQLQAITGRMPLPLRYFAGVGTHRMRARYQSGPWRAESDELDFASTVTRLEAGASLLVPLSRRIQLEGGMELPFRLSQQNWGRSPFSGALRFGFAYHFAKPCSQ
ncbi:MAG: hypothetical protein JJ896_14380 [Rhodothermales bacterium]|nr:hypothetical protein [Rhodothermales bacterium]